MSFKSFLACVGNGLAKVGVATVKGAVFVSTDPKVVTTIAALAGHPEIGAAIVAGSTAVSAGNAIVDIAKTGNIDGAVAAAPGVVADVKSTVDAIKAAKK